MRQRSAPSTSPAAVLAAAPIDELTADARGPLTPMFYSYLVSASGLAAMSLGALLYAVPGEGERTVEGAQPASADRGPKHFSARYREQMKLTQETLSDFGYTPGPSDGTMGVSTASALRAFQRKEGLRVTGRSNPETLAALGIEDTLSRRAAVRTLGVTLSRE